MKTFPTLYQRTNTGALQRWDISVEAMRVNVAGVPADVGVIVTRWGQDEGAIQETQDVVSTGKNLGKKNATTPLEQAVLEAEAKWTKKVKREGYVEDRARAEAGESDRAGGVAPMLAQPQDKAHRISYPVDVQRKLNGVRCIVIVDDGRVGLWSRKQTPIEGVPHVKAAYERAFAGVAGRFVLDGELFKAGWSLQTISGFVRKAKEPKVGYEQLEHHVYDLPLCPSTSMATPWLDRKAAIAGLWNAWAPALTLESCLVRVQTFEAESFEVVQKLHAKFVAEGMEGAMMRNHHGSYEADKRSYHLVKVKSFQEKEFEIIGVQAGRGKFAGVAIFSCAAGNGKAFECTAPGTMEEKAAYLARGAELIGKPLTVKYFELSDDGTPLFPVGLAVRTYE